jgi:hypothetical protein
MIKPSAAPMTMPNAIWAPPPISIPRTTPSAAPNAKPNPGA